MQRVDIHSNLDANVLKEMCSFSFTEIGIMTNINLPTEIDLGNVMMVADSHTAPALINFCRPKSKSFCLLCQLVNVVKLDIFIGKFPAHNEKLMKAIMDKCEDLGLSADPTTVICDFEQGE